MTKGEVIVSRDNKLKGLFTGAHHRCKLDGCNGRRLSVKWEDGTHTFPCSKGLVVRGGRWRIG